jgi:hypothetical protein
VGPLKQETSAQQTWGCPLAKHEYNAEQTSLREATQHYIDLLPPAHKGLLQLMAKDYQKPPHALIAGAIEQLILSWTQEIVPDTRDIKPVPVRRSA